MNAATCASLLALNRQFYAAVAVPFDATRQEHTSGKRRLAARIGALHPGRPLRVLDVGCGNGRLALMLDDLERPIRYVGVDGEPQLLDLACNHTVHLRHVAARFVQADLADPGWADALGPERFDAVVCLATLQHLPGYALRRQVLEALGQLVAPQGRIVVSAWQFLASPRLRARILDWSAAGIDAAEVEHGDALLPWKRDVYAIRYVHHIDADEFERLAADANLSVMDAYRADGRTNDLNLYVMFETLQEHKIKD